MSNIAQNTTDLQAVLDAVNALPDKVDTSGTATAADIFTGKTATVNDQKITGANPYNAANVDPAVADALAALTEKGVDSTGKGLADLAALIAAIEAGGGGVKMVTGSFTLAEDTTGTYYVEPDLSPLALPGEDNETLYNKCFAFLALDNPKTLKGTYGFAIFRVNPTGTRAGVSGGYDGSSMSNDAQDGTCNLNYSYGLQLKFGSTSARIGLAGHTYRYYIWRAYE